MSKSKPRRRTWKVDCPHCEGRFTVRFAVAGEEPADKESTGRVGVDCLHCSKPVMIPLPRKYIAEENILRGEPG